MTSTVKNLLIAFPISLILVLAGILAKIFYDLFLPALLNPHGGVAAAAILRLQILLVIEPLIFLAVFLILQWRTTSRNVND